MRALARGAAPPRREIVTPAAQKPVAPPPVEEVAIIAILADHPHLLEMAEEKGVDSLLTDARLRDMYSAAREGRPVVTAISADLGPVAQRILSREYAGVTNPAATLLHAIEGLRYLRERRRRPELESQILAARKRGDTELERELMRQIMALRKQVD
jgi:hypothetical protein